METRIREELERVLAQWRAGEEIRVPELGHTQQMIPHPGEADRIDHSKTVTNDQQRAYGYVFFLIDYCLVMGVPETFEAFDLLNREAKVEYQEKILRAICLTAEEVDGARSLAWKALRIGWARAIVGHADERYVTIKKAEDGSRRQ